MWRTDGLHMVYLPPHLCEQSHRG
ncbi:hypothetical protein [Pseudaminobacter soli (ex Li et al. 2025)]